MHLALCQVCPQLHQLERVQDGGAAAMNLMRAGSTCLLFNDVDEDQLPRKSWQQFVSKCAECLEERDEETGRLAIKQKLLEDKTSKMRESSCYNC